VRKRLKGTALGPTGPVWASLAAALVTALAASLAGCGDDPGPITAPTPTTPPSVLPAERDQLAALAAAAKDNRYVATYTLVTSKRADRTVTVATATDGTWVVAVPAGALSGLADIAIYHSSTGTFQCTLGPAAGTAGTRPDLEPIAAGCVAAPTPATAGAAPTLPTANDPQVEHIFTDWIDALVDRATALSVAPAPALPGARGTCFSVESTAAALAPPVDPGVYCYDATGVLTAARVGFGTLTLTGPVAAAPPSVTMPGPVVARPLLAVVAPAAPSSRASKAPTRAP
jgi:hypothetical protein